LPGALDALFGLGFDPPPKWGYWRSSRRRLKAMLLLPWQCWVPATSQQRARSTSEQRALAMLAPPGRSARQMVRRTWLRFTPAALWRTVTPRRQGTEKALRSHCAAGQADPSAIGSLRAF